MAAPRRVVELAFPDEEVAELARLARSRTEPASRVERARMLLCPAIPASAGCSRCDPLAPELRRAGHAPTRHNQLTLAIPSDSDDGSELVGEDRGEERQIASAVVAFATSSP